MEAILVRIASSLAARTVRQTILGPEARLGGFDLGAA